MGNRAKKSVKVVLCGPSQSGKSCLRYGLKEAIKTIVANIYALPITANPDGEGSWFQETVSNDEALARLLKDSHKGKYTRENIRLWADWVKNYSLPLALVDIGGIADEITEEICAHATHAILLTRDMDLLDDWRAFCGKLNLEIIAEIHSDHQGTSDNRLTLGSDGIYRGSIHGLNRGDLTVKDRPTVIQLARVLVGIVDLRFSARELAEKYEVTRPRKRKYRRSEMRTFKIQFDEDGILRVGFGASDHNDSIVKDASSRLDEMVESGDLRGGELIMVDGPMSLPAAMVLAHRLGHLYQAVACYDPKLSKYVVAIAHGDKYRVGDLID